MQVIDLNNKFYLYTTNSSKYVIIVHGMVETFDGYMELKDFLLSVGYNVVLYNQRGHGDAGRLAHLFKNEAYSLVNDLVDISVYIQKNLQSTSISVISHSMGTFVTRAAMKTFKYSKVILNGMPKSSNYFLVNLAYILFVGNRQKRTKTFNKLVFNSYNKKVGGKSEFDWVCNNSNYMDYYLTSKYCGVYGTKGFYKEILLLSVLAKEKNIIATNVMLTSGCEDPVSEFGKTFKKCVKMLETCGCSVSTILYNDMRHFIYGETNKKLCFNDIKDFLESR